MAEQIASFGTTSLRAFSVSSNGVLAYRTGTNLAQVQLAWFDRTGRRLETLGETVDYSNPALSPDGKRVAVGRRDPKSLMRDIWLFELERGTASRLTFDPADDFNPAFSRDGTRILFTSTRKGPRDIYRKASTGVGEDEPVLESEGASNVDDGRRTAVSSCTTRCGAPGPRRRATSGWRRSTATASRFRSWCGRSPTTRLRSRPTAA